MNSQFLRTSMDMGQDSLMAAKDAYGYSLGYYNNDYKPIGGTAYNAFNSKYTQAAGDITGQSLYNGNISNSTLALSQLNIGAMVGYTYHYDQLNRLKKTRQHTGITMASTSWSRSSITLNYQENVTYDGNGNILTYGRNGAAPTAQTIDSLSYNFSRNSSGRLLNNQLQYIHDAIATSNYSLDLTNQTNTTNYRYDAIGNLIYDAQSGITGNDGVNAITWSVYGKIQSIYKTTGTISYTYNPAGQRVSKTAAGLTTYYIRDAQGNTLALYDNAGSAINWREQHLYGSSRLGMWTPNVNLSTGNEVVSWDTTGRKQYELNNHLGNVLATISEKRLQHSSGSGIDYYTADVATAQDYYPFGMLQPERQYTFTGGTYRYGFNGKENDNEVKGLGNQQDYGMRIYDDRVGRFLSVDPLQVRYPMLTPYQFASNGPIENIDLDGLEKISQKLTMIDDKPVLKTTSIGPKDRSVWQKIVDADFSSQITLEYNIEYSGQTYNFSPSSEKLNNGLHPTYSMAEMKNFLTAPDQTGLTSQESADGAFQKQIILNTALYDASHLVESGNLILNLNLSNSAISIHNGNPEATKSQFEINKKNGSLYESMVKQELEKTQNNVQEQVMIKTKTTRTKMDFIGIDKETGELILTEAKASESAPLTKNQKIAHPEIEKHGGKVVGKGKPGYKKGTKIPAAKVNIKRQN